MELLLVILLFLYSTIFIVGFTGNLLMVLVTLHSNKLRSICNILICVCCFCDLLLFTDVIAFVVSMFTPSTQEFCFYISIPADFGAFASNACVLAIGIDRLIAVAAPTRYKLLENERYKYLFLQMTFPVIYSSTLLIMGFGQRDPRRNVVCLLPESLGHAYDMFALSSFGINLFVPPLYAYVYFKVKNMSDNNSIKTVFKSLSVTVCLVVCGWMTTDLIGALTVILPMDRSVARMVQLYCGTFIFTSSAFNAVVYYKFSRDYRSAVRTMLGLSDEVSIANINIYQQASDPPKSSNQRPFTNTS
ncbi:G-protein coupled receptors family 1 profile domain-containing protein [Caenorhabditis elegans]|uniref:G-protein coupled receptors family 1 profile domain-containing protein n=1 Tax=Caenorhabditis elegans TaxID=6239 RepID=O17961_CAEEL|nr:G-protein coupled receptors family 1 profile domain-containing protein [Caenorhabditis elegans]CAB05565.2 G-protein coupled receptors family 1 profile domain-containing protein [Caenorhabditis elegans]|eukprot:NP_506777.2 Serpentine Receptor, class SX [Caenorhabditis elegans]